MTKQSADNIHEIIGDVGTGIQQSKRWWMWLFLYPDAATREVWLDHYTKGLNFE